MSSIGVDKIAGMNEMSYIEFIAKEKWRELSDFVNFFPDITGVVTEENFPVVKAQIDSTGIWEKNVAIGCNILHFLSMFSNRIEHSLELINSVFRRNQISVNCRNKCGCTPLMEACINSSVFSNVETVKLLIDSGADVDAQDERGRTALMFSCVSVCYPEKSLEITKVLIECGANVNLRSATGFTALMSACLCLHSCSSLEIVRFVIESGADVGAIGQHGSTAYSIGKKSADAQHQTEFEKLFKVW